MLDPTTGALAFGPAAARQRADAAARPIFLALPACAGRAADGSDGDGSMSDGSEADAGAATPDDGVDDNDDIDIGAGHPGATHAHGAPRSPSAHRNGTPYGPLVHNHGDSR